MNRSLLVALLIVPLAAVGQDSPFEEAPNKATMFSRGTLAKGTRLEFSFSNARDNETLLLQRCGEPCDTAKLIQSWRLAAFPVGARLITLLEEDGQYYFWIQRRLAGGEVGGVKVESSTPSADSVKVKYISGTEVTVKHVAPRK